MNNVPSLKDDIAESPRISAQSLFRSIRMKLLASTSLVLLIGLPVYANAQVAQNDLIQIDDRTLAEPWNRPGDWMAYGLTQGEDRFSPLKQIDKDNVAELGLAWAKKLGTTRGLECTPLVINGIMYISLPWSGVMAIDSRNGETLWEWDPQVDRAIFGRKACCDVVNRGLAFYKGNLFVGVFDGRLVALDASNGSVVWETRTFDQNQDYTITGAPRIFDGKVVIGNGGAEFGVRGFVTAYFCDTGEMAWRTYTVPGDPKLGFESPDMEKAAKTWSGEWWIAGGGGTCWDSFSYDPELKLLYVGTGNGSPWTRIGRNQTNKLLDNLYLSSILALNADDGSIVWHYQTTPGDNWDYTAVQQMILTDIEWKGSMRQVILQAPKNGFFYILDRKTGELLAADAFIELNWAERVDLETGRPIETAFSDYSTFPREIKPSQAGGHSWHPMSYNPQTKLVYIPTNEATRVFQRDPEWEYTPGAMNMGLDNDTVARTQIHFPQGGLIAWDPIKRKRVWTVDHSNQFNGGTLASAGDLVFQGNGEGNFNAYDAKTGKELWSFFTGTAIIAPPVTYLVNGDQFLSVLAGWGGGLGLRNPPTGKAAEYFQEGILYTFKLGGNSKQPSLVKHPRTRATGPDIDIEINEAYVEPGRVLYIKNCGRCHGSVDGKAGIIPDLATTPPEFHQIWQQIVGEGIFASSKGMPPFKHNLSSEEITYIQHFVISESKLLAENEKEKNE
ncbi:MAG: PQQ-dependent dehydrogenase, methanol/ethanol family [Verrucomicrobia bacterium]|nr:PQQ-dependent dehydrogenase, methanol/ethanol family [Verrucomicrobiota bacterium]